MAGALGSGLAAQPAAAQAPPPVPQAVAFHVAIEGKPAGPFDLTALEGKVREGALTRSTLVWKPGMANWAAAGAVPELAKVLESAPPPLPPA
jgi:hypothetical protein